jgi:tryptophan 2,3-dioxygenase
LQKENGMLYTQSDMLKSHIDQDMQETADLLRRSEERVLQKGIVNIEALRKRYKQAEQIGDTALAKKLRREYYQELFINVSLATSYRDLLFPDPQLQAMMDKISQETGS